MSTHALENFYWISQVTLAIVAIFAAFVAFSQIRTFKLFELLKYLESSDIRKCRRIVLHEIDRRKDENWWDDPTDGERLESAASDVCATYDLLGRMIEFDTLERVFPKGGYGIFFRRYWGWSITRTHDALEHFLEYRRIPHDDAYRAFSRLAVSARDMLGHSVGKPLQSN